MSPLKSLVFLPLFIAVRHAAAADASAAKSALAAACAAGNCYAGALAKDGGFAAKDLATAESAWLCETKNPSCASIRRAVDGLIMADEALARCRQGECPPEALSAACRGVSDGRDYSIVDDDATAGTYARQWLNELVPTLDAVVAGKLGAGLAASESELAGLEKALGSPAPGAAGVDDLSRRLIGADSKWRSATRSTNSCKASTPSVERMNVVARGRRGGASAGSLRQGLPRSSLGNPSRT